MLIDPTGKMMGMDVVLAYFEVLPFSDILFKNYIFPGFSLLIVNGITNLIATFLLLKKKKSGIILGGIFGMHGWSMKINETDKNLEKYDKVTICTPIWVFGISAPIKEFCKLYSGKLKQVDYVLVHFIKAKFNVIASEMDELLKIKHSGFKSICTRMGKIKKIDE